MTNQPATKLQPMEIIPISMVDSVWTYLHLTDFQVRGTKKWFIEAAKMNSGRAAELEESKGLPNSIVTGLYPEISAFGPNGFRTVEALQVFREIDHYLSSGQPTKKKKQAVEAALEKFGNQINRPRSRDEYRISSFFSSAYAENADVEGATEVMAQNLRYQVRLILDSFICLDTTHLRETFERVLEHVGFMFMAHASDVSESYGVEELLLEFNEIWEKLRADLKKARFEISMPVFTEEPIAYKYIYPE